MTDQVNIPSLDPARWPRLISFIVNNEVESWEFSPYTDDEIKAMSGKRDKA